MRTISARLLHWFDQYGRHDLPWQSEPANPYHVWLSEIMLQQTQVTTVIDYFNRFIRAFPSIKALAQAEEDAVLAQWAGLGYYARARNLQCSAKIMLKNHGGEVPNSMEQLLALPGIGESTAGAILSLAYEQPHAILDGNVKRVLARYHQVSGHYEQNSIIKHLWQLSKQHTPNKRNKDYTQAVMDLGATVCVRSQPKCSICPLQDDCQACQNQTQSQYPQPRPKKVKPTKTVAMLIFRNKKGWVYLEKRPNKGIWSGLWSFPECKNTPDAIHTAIQAFAHNTGQQDYLPIFKHTFTHYHLDIQPIVINIDNAGSNMGQHFYSPQQSDLGLPSPITKIIAQLFTKE